jgi:hypothetical protein
MITTQENFSDYKDKLSDSDYDSELKKIWAQKLAQKVSAVLSL